MMIMKRIQLFMILIFSGAVLWSCSDDADDVDIDANRALYELTLINGTDSEVEVFFLINEVDAEFGSKGFLEPG